MINKLSIPGPILGSLHLNQTSKQKVSVMCQELLEIDLAIYMFVFLNHRVINDVGLSINISQPVVTSLFDGGLNKHVVL